MVKLLIDNKADVNIAAKDGSTPLHVAFVKGTSFSSFLNNNKKKNTINFLVVY